MKYGAAMSGSNPPPPIALARDRLHVLGDAFAVDGRVSWIPAQERGWQATNAYLLTPAAPTSGGNADAVTLIDPGPRIHGRTVARQLTTIVGEDPALTVILTRGERDTLGATDLVSEGREVRRLIAGGVPNLFDGFEALSANVGEDGSRDGRFVQATRMRSGSTIDLGDRQLVVFSPLLKVLATYWYYDTLTATLFTSDSFGQLLGTTPEQARTPSGDADPLWTSPEQLDRHLLTKFWWLDRAVLAPVLANVDAIFADHPIERICPSHGRVIEGEVAVTAAYTALHNALLRLGSDTRTGGTR